MPGALFYASAIGTLLVMVRGRSALRWPDWLWTAGMLAIGVWTVRGLAWWPFAAAFVVAAALPVVLAPALGGRSRAIGPAEPDRRDHRHAVRARDRHVAAVVAARRPADGPRGAARPTPRPASRRPSGTGTKPGDRVFLPQTWASWFEWAAPAPGYFLDSRFELFPATVWDDYDTIDRGGPDAQAVLDRWSVNVVVLPTGADASARDVDHGPQRTRTAPCSSDPAREPAYAGVARAPTTRRPESTGRSSPTGR